MDNKDSSDKLKKTLIRSYLGNVFQEWTVRTNSKKKKIQVSIKVVKEEPNKKLAIQLNKNFPQWKSKINEIEIELKHEFNEDIDPLINGLVLDAINQMELKTEQLKIEKLPKKQLKKGYKISYILH